MTYHECTGSAAVKTAFDTYADAVKLAERNARTGRDAVNVYYCECSCGLWATTKCVQSARDAAEVVALSKASPAALAALASATRAMPRAIRSQAIRNRIAGR